MIPQSAYKTMRVAFIESIAFCENRHDSATALLNVDADLPYITRLAE
jgi:hypothetical protein